MFEALEVFLVGVFEVLEEWIEEIEHSL